MKCYLGLGANIGNPAEQLAAAISALSATDRVRLERVSSVYRTAPVGYAEQPDFLNMVIRVETEHAPEALLEIVGGIEDRLGRVRSIENGPRTIDIDILLCEGIEIDTARLTVPHPRIAERQFVLVPLSEIAPDLVLPDGRDVSELVDAGAAGVVGCGSLAELIRRGRSGDAGPGIEGF